MPKRSNTFQSVVAIVSQHFAGDAEVEESALLPHTLTDELREVDVIIRSKVAGHPVVVAIEATGTKRAANVTWVEQMVKKHEYLPTHKLILISQNGFTKNASKLADVHAVATIAPIDLDVSDPEQAVIGKLPSLWPKVVSLSPERVRVHVRRPDGKVVWFKAVMHHRVYTDAGEELGTLDETIKAYINAGWKRIIEDIDLANISETMTRGFSLTIEPHVVRVEDRDVSLCLRNETNEIPELHPIAVIEVVGRAEIEVQQVNLKRHRLGDVEYAYAEAEIKGRKSLVVATGGEDGEGSLTLRFPPEEQQ